LHVNWNVVRQRSVGKLIIMGVRLNTEPLMLIMPPGKEAKGPSCVCLVLTGSCGTWLLPKFPTFGRPSKYRDGFDAIIPTMKK
jgi:hypothetical protein